MVERAPGGSVVKNLPAKAGDAGDVGSIPALERFLVEGHSNAVFLPGESHGQEEIDEYNL